jgi:hypothetical protein
MESLTIEDITLINDLSSRTYPGFNMASNAEDDEQIKFNQVKLKLLKIANYFANRYLITYGPFMTSVSPERNPLTRGKRLHNVWSTFYKGSVNKQYAAQISFVIDQHSPCLNVGFYFGRASARTLEENQRIAFETNLTNLGIRLSDTIMNNQEFDQNYISLFDFGFIAYSEGVAVLPNEWINSIRTNAKNSQITAKIFPNEFGVIENSTLDSFVSQIIFMMSSIIDVGQQQPQIVIAPLTPGQRAKEAERLAEIGHKGELFILAEERRKLLNLGIEITGYPRHVALESTHFGYDILSLDENQDEIFIEVKSTTRTQEDERAKSFFITNNEVQVCENNEEQYFIYRVYSVENNPYFEILKLKELNRKPNGYIINF